MTNFQKNHLCMYGNCEDRPLPDLEQCPDPIILKKGDWVKNFKYIYDEVLKNDYGRIYFDFDENRLVLLPKSLMFETVDGETFDVVDYEFRHNYFVFFLYDNLKNDHICAHIHEFITYETMPSYKQIMENKKEILANPNFKNLSEEVNDENFDDNFKYFVLCSDQIEEVYALLNNTGNFKTEYHTHE